MTRPVGGGRQASTWPCAAVLVALLLVVGAVTLGPPPGEAADIVYHYDRLGRLIAVVDPASDTAVYNYDAVGNLLSITRHSSSSVAVIGFDPPSGPIGATVRIQGTGFSATPAQNTVTFNGVTATVSSASATQLVVTVPSGATTGAIGVTAPAGAATSATSFTVATSSGSPTITSFTPTIGTSGTSISISGTNFETTPANNRLTFNLAQAPVSTATGTSLSVPVPTGATSGRLSLATPGGDTQSADDFFVPPWSYSATSVSGTGRISIGGATGSATITGGDKIALLVFEGAAGQQVSLGVGVGGVTITDTYIFRPDGTQLAWLYSEFYGGDYHIASLPVTGTYTIMVVPRGPYAGTKGITLSQDLIAGPITVDGSSVAVNITRPGQRARMSFSGTTGQRLNLGFLGMSFYGSIIVTKPDGTTLTSFNGSSDYSIVMPPLPSTGTYGILIDPPGVDTPNMMFTLSEEIGGSITIDGATVPLSLTRFGQVARVTFSGTAGQRLNLAFTDITVPSPWVSILKPDGSQLVGGSIWAGWIVMETGPLPASGTYTIVVDPYQGNTGDLTLILSEEISGTISIGGSSVAASTTRPGQRARLTFSGTASQRISLNVTGVTTNGSVGVSLIKPDGSLISWWPAGSAMTVYDNGAGFIGPFTLPSTETTYALLVAPNMPATGSLTAQLYDVPADPTASLTVNGAGATLTFSAPGQNGSVTFTGTSGQGVTIRGTNGTVGCFYLIGILWPNGASTAWAPFCGSSFNFGITAQTGMHTFSFDPQGANTGSIDVTVTSP